MLLLLTATSLAICYYSAPHADRVKTAAAMGVDPRSDKLILEPRSRPGEWLEYSPLPTLFICTLGFIWMANEFWAKGFLRAIADLNSYNLIFLLFGMLLNWRPKRFLLVFDKAVPATAGVLIQFPIYSVIAFLLSKVKDSAGLTLTDHLTHAFVNIATRDTFAPLVGIYSAVLGFFLPSGGGKWLVEAPYVMQTSVDLKAHLGWTVQAYNAAEEIKARDSVGFTFLQFLVHVPLVIFALWIFGKTFEYVPPMRP
jgi:short-chain fatty acids transporter